MNIINVKIDFEHGICQKQGISVVTGDYNSTKVVFEFDESAANKTKMFEMKNPNNELVYYDEIINNEIILVGEKEEEGEIKKYSLFNEEGDYTFEVSLYGNDSKLTSVCGYITANKEQVIIDGEIVEEYIPTFENLLNEITGKIEEANNLNISAEQLDDGISVTITNRDGEPKTAVINDGERGETGPQGNPGRDATINGVNTLNIIEGTNIRLEQNGSNMKISNTYTYDDTEVKTDINNLKTNKADKSEIPTKVSQLQNDSGFITNAVNDLINYYLKSETYSKSEVNDLISAITTLDLRVVETLPTQDISTTTIYLVPKSSAGTNDAYDEYIYVSNNWEFIGSTQVDLTDYVKNTNYANSTTGGVVRVNENYAVSTWNTGNIFAQVKTYSQYQGMLNYMFIGKGTLENVIEGKGLTTKAYVDGLVGDISSVIDSINGEVV